MAEKIRILFLSASSWSMSRILVDEEAREISEKIHEGRYRDRFELYKYSATRPNDLQRLLLRYQPHIVHFSCHGSKGRKIVLAGPHGGAKSVDQQGLAGVFARYSNHVRLVVLNACFSNEQARSISGVIDYSIGTERPIGDKVSVAFAGAFYRALGFGKSIRDAFESARAELALTKMPRSRGIQLFIKKGITERDTFPQIDISRNSSRRRLDLNVVLKTETRCEVKILKTIKQTVLVWKQGRSAGAIRSSDDITPDWVDLCGVAAALHAEPEGVMKMLKQQAKGKNLTRKQAQSAFHQSGGKAPGTRVGVLIDWRISSANSERQSGRYGRSLRDGK